MDLPSETSPFDTDVDLNAVDLSDVDLPDDLLTNVDLQSDDADQTLPAPAGADLPDTTGKPGPKTRQPGDVEQTRALRALIRKTASKAEELASTPTAQTSLLGLLLGIGANRGLADLTAAAMLADKSVLEPVDDLLLIASTDPLEAGVLVANWSRPQLKAVWALLDAIGANLPGAQPPADHTKAVMAAAKAILATTAETLEVLRSTAALIPGRRL